MNLTDFSIFYTNTLESNILTFTFCNILLNYVISNSDKLVYIKLIILQVLNIVLSGYAYFFVYTDINSNIYTDVLGIIITLELSYYLSDSVSRILHKEYDFVLHHVFTIILYVFSFNLELYGLMIKTIFYLTISNPFLSTSKYLYKKNKINDATIMFIVFAMTFFITRIYYGYELVCDVHKLTNNYLIIIFTYSLYSLLWFWFFKILSVIYKRMF